MVGRYRMDILGLLGLFLVVIEGILGHRVDISIHYGRNDVLRIEKPKDSKYFSLSVNTMARKHTFRLFWNGKHPNHLKIQQNDGHIMRMQLRRPSSELLRLIRMRSEAFYHLLERLRQGSYARRLTLNQDLARILIKVPSVISGFIIDALDNFEAEPLKKLLPQDPQTHICNSGTYWQKNYQVYDAIQLTASPEIFLMHIYFKSIRSLPIL